MIERTAEGAEAAVSAANDTSQTGNTLYAQERTSGRWVTLDVPSLDVVDKLPCWSTHWVKRTKSE